jgi:hypothetical protein
MTAQHDTDKEHARRIREAQLRARDPGDSKIPGYDWAKHSAKPRPKRPPLLVEMFTLLPHRWRGLIFGMVFGGIVGLIMRLLLLNDELAILALVPVLICGIVGFVIGAVMQTTYR